MNGLESFRYTYGLPAIAAVPLIKSAGVPIPIPADGLMLAVAGSAFEAFHEASCPVCLAWGAIDRVNPARQVEKRQLHADVR
jgi:hypothetical protein